MSQDFNWNELDDDDMIVRQQSAVAAYFNPKGDIVIRQQAAMYGDEDAVVVLSVEACDRLIRRLTELRHQAKDFKPEE